MDYAILASPRCAPQTEKLIIAANEINSSDLDELAQRLAVSEAAEQALGKVIQIIARSAGDLDRSMQAVLEGALDLCDAQLGILYRYEAAKGFRAEHMKGVPQPFFDFLTNQGWFRGDQSTGIGRMETQRAPVNIDDVVGEDFYAQREPLRVATVELGGARSFLAVPMLAGEELVGALTIYRQEGMSRPLLKM